MAQRDIFLKIDGIEGESEDHQHKGEIDVLSWSWEEKQSGTSSMGTGITAGKVSMQDFKFSMYVNKATPKLVLACASGTCIKEAVLTCRKATGEQQQTYLQYKFSDLIISSYKTGVANALDDVIPKEEITFNYSRIEVEYKVQQSSGAMGGTIAAGWDLKANRKI